MAPQLATSAVSFRPRYLDAISAANGTRATAISLEISIILLALLIAGGGRALGKKDLNVRESLY
jgi:hypothetical protein